MRKTVAPLNVARVRWRRATEVIVHISRTRDAWRGAVENLITLQKLLRFYDIMCDATSEPRQRFYCTVQLALYFRDDKDVAKKIFNIKKRLQQVTWNEIILQNITSAENSLYDWFTPSRIGEHRLWFSPIFVIVVLSLYSYMLADFRNYNNESIGWHIKSGLKAKFDSSFLNTWKAFNVVAVVKDGEGQRWFTSWIEHEGLQHLASNLAIFLVLSRHLEHRYGTTRIILISFSAGLGGNLMSAVLDSPCSQVVGASGLIFGLAGFWLADLIVNFHFIKSAVRHCCLVVIFFVLFLITVFTRSNVSNWSHLGGFITGLLPAFLVLPRMGQQKLELGLLYVGLTGWITYFSIMFPVTYRVRLRYFNSDICESAVG